MRKKFRLLLILAMSSLGACGVSPVDRSLGFLESCQTMRVKDGDSVLAACGGKVFELRLYCIDAPELSQKPYGTQSKLALSAELGKHFDARFQGEDRFGRMLATLWRGQREINLELVRAGDALVYQHYCDQPEYLLAESKARRAQQGVWNSQHSFIPPWQWRRR